MMIRSCKRIRLPLLVIIVVLAGAGLTLARTADPNYQPGGHGGGNVATVTPAYCLATHNVGKMNFGVSNNGTIGRDYSSSGSQDCFTGELVAQLEYPKGSNTQYLYGAAFWIGAVSLRDTLVSVGQDGWIGGFAEFNPDVAPLGNMIYRSTIDPAKPEYKGAVSEQDYIAVYTDTFTSGVPGLQNDPVDNRPHIPLYVEVTQRSFAWSYSYADDFVLFDYAIKNIGTERLHRVFLGVYVDADVHAVVNANGYDDDICGFLHTIDAAYLPVQCPDTEVVNLAWIADNDGDLTRPPGQEVPNITGMRIVRAPQDSLEVSFNWWVGNADAQYDFGPMTYRAFRNLGTGGTGTPEGDRNKYAFLSNGEFDYDQVYTCNRDPFDPEFLPPNPDLACDLADGYDTRYLLSFGPFDIEPGQTLPLSFAYVGGLDFHTDPNNGRINLIENSNPDEFYKNVHFDKLGENAIWAEWIYDNPGVDTDSDGYAGVFYPCTLSAGDPPTVKMIARKGDGVPDFRGANPPPAPLLRVEASTGQVRVYWNGARSETTFDNFSGEADFEGYRVYVGRDDREQSMSVIQSYDFENYNKWVWDDSLIVGDRQGAFDLKDSPFSLDTLRCLYADGGCNDSSWDPLNYPRNRPFSFGDSLFYFAPQDFNRSVLQNAPNLPQNPDATTDIWKRFPDAKKPIKKWIDHPDSIPASIWNDPVVLDSLIVTDRLPMGDTLFKYYEYELIVKDLLPTVPYWINVTAFDYGSPQSGLPSLETSPTIRAAVAYAIDGPSPGTGELKAYVWPNPYRLDAGYRANSYEGFLQDDRAKPDDRVRAVNFGGLPAKCTIRIYTLDGDLVREITHDYDTDSPVASHDSWDLITRNTQLAVSGLYYWTVEADDGRTQIGKLVLIM